MPPRNFRQEFPPDPLAEQDPAAQHHEDGRGVGEQRGVGDRGMVQRQMPEREVTGEKGAREQQPAVLAGGPGLAFLARAGGDRQPQPDHGNREKRPEKGAR
jgi:hypothetical protein